MVRVAYTRKPSRSPPDRRTETLITHPEQGGPFAPVVIYIDVWGLREELYDIARKVAVVGYYVDVPDLY